MKLLVAGGTGFIGAPLCRTLAEHGHEVMVLSRGASARPREVGVRFLSLEGSEWPRLLGDVQGVINLAGESIAGKRWGAGRKLRLRESRVQTTRRLVSALADVPRRPSVLVNASAVGYYGARGDEELAETDPPGAGFLAELCQVWEAEARRAEAFGVRVVRLRLGVVLGPDGGALEKMVPPFRWGLGGPLGSGRQWVSWIHIQDVIGLIEWALTNPDISGAVNATAQNPVTMREFAGTLGRVLRRPSWAPVPSAALRLLLGEMADELLLASQRVLPRAALKSGFAFRFPELAPALADATRGCNLAGGQVKS